MKMEVGLIELLDGTLESDCQFQHGFRKHCQNQGRKQTEDDKLRDKRDHMQEADS